MELEGEPHAGLFRQPIQLVQVPARRLKASRVPQLRVVVPVAEANQADAGLGANGQDPLRRHAGRVGQVGRCHRHSQPLPRQDANGLGNALRRLRLHLVPAADEQIDAVDAQISRRLGDLFQLAAAKQLRKQDDVHNSSTVA
jgi:hypothetical protein